jgi:hypothetical protein
MRKQELIEMQKRTDLTQAEIASIDKEIQDLILKLIKIK